MSKVTICGIEAGPKERVYGTLPVTTMANGSDLSIPVHILNGANPGPRILLTAVSHGDATTGLEVIRQVLESVNLEELSGTVIAVPCQNPIGLSGIAAIRLLTCIT